LNFALRAGDFSYTTSREVSARMVNRWHPACTTLVKVRAVRADRTARGMCHDPLQAISPHSLPAKFFTWSQDDRKYLLFICNSFTERKSCSAPDKPSPERRPHVTFGRRSKPQFLKKRPPRLITLFSCRIIAPSTRKYCVMLAVAERSVVLLVNPASDRLARLPAQFRTRIELSRALLRHFVQVSKTSLRLLGHVGDAAASFRSLPNCQIIAGDALSFWRENDVGRRLGPFDTQVIYIGGAWLDQDVLGAALSAAEIGYDTRVLVDVSVAQTQFDRAWALERLQQHDVLMTTMRQTMTEWSLAAPDETTSRQLRDTLQQ
jgi:hypothetical protein